tara:strand:- start:590 stop:793 length:204 start_codon:yes stop_codon:yes gene_type:complete
MESLISQLDRMHISENKETPPPQTVDPALVWKTLRHLHKENTQLKKYIAYLIQHTTLDGTYVPEWVY